MSFYSTLDPPSYLFSVGGGKKGVSKVLFRDLRLEFPAAPGGPVPSMGAEHWLRFDIIFGSKLKTGLYPLTVMINSQTTTDYVPAVGQLAGGSFISAIVIGNDALISPIKVCVTVCVLSRIGGDAWHVQDVSSLSPKF